MVSFVTASYRGESFPLDEASLPVLSEQTIAVCSKLRVNLPSNIEPILTTKEHASGALLAAKVGFAERQFTAVAAAGYSAIFLCAWILLVIFVSSSTLNLAAWAIISLCFVCWMIPAVTTSIRWGCFFAKARLSQQKMMDNRRKIPDSMIYVFWISISVLCPLIIIFYPYLNKRGWQKIVDQQSSLEPFWRQKNIQMVNEAIVFYTEKYADFCNEFKRVYAPKLEEARISSARKELEKAHKFYFSLPAVQRKVHGVWDTVKQGECVFPKVLLSTISDYFFIPGNP